MFYRCAVAFLLLFPLQGAAQLPDPAWLNPQRQTALMQQAIELYTCIANANEWHTLPDDLRLSPGDTNLAVLKLKRNLLLTKDLPLLQTDSMAVYDSLLVAATINFQKRNGIKADGVIGPKTVAAINIPPSQRLKLLQANLLRWQNSTAHMPFPTVYINIPDYRLYILDTSRVLLQMRVIVGKKETPTYQNQTELLSIVVNPNWNIPRSIAVNEILPILRRNPNYLYKRHMRLYLDGRQLNPWRVNWKKVNASNFNYQIVQLPGKQNELGELKFLYNSKANQYMHDTPRKELFKFDQRNFSHGCIRIEKPDELAMYLLQYRSGQSKEKAKQLLARWDRNLYLRIRKPMPLLIGYQTCWVSYDGKVQFREDIYGYETVKL
ncbi:L,D-transpeptidase family protein [Pontibacter fetidus]|uniref:L,D-transpeptidase family protein n=1 Tax=Pontibacter fetidus TaxID=2700082 RepID=A0A6B2H395_9BACT|nr:L,D-transpeptidase family protein [Pontibacter fetidus]NDK56568.1 L,D-transpeptidase family protein [Pontibacter fetidus]